MSSFVCVCMHSCWRLLCKICLSVCDCVSVPHVCGCTTWLWVCRIYPHALGEGCEFWLGGVFCSFLSVCCVTSLTRCLPLTTGNQCQWLSAGKHCLRERETRQGERETQRWRNNVKTQRPSFCLQSWKFLMFAHTCVKSFWSGGVGIYNLQLGRNDCFRLFVIRHKRNGYSLSKWQCYFLTKKAAISGWWHTLI